MVMPLTGNGDARRGGDCDVWLCLGGLVFTAYLGHRGGVKMGLGFQRHCQVGTSRTTEEELINRKRPRPEAAVNDP